MRLFKKLIPLFLIIGTAYGGGLFFGTHPEYLRNFWGQKKLVIGITQGARVLDSSSLQWLQDRCSRNLELRILEGTSKPELFGVDLLLVPSVDLSLYSESFQNPPVKLVSLIDNNLLRDQDRALPFLWKIIRNPGQKNLLLRWLIADVSGESGNTEIMTLFLNPDFQQILISTNPEFVTTLKEQLTEKNLDPLRETPLKDLNY